MNSNVTDINNLHVMTTEIVLKTLVNTAMATFL